MHGTPLPVGQFMDKVVLALWGTYTFSQKEAMANQARACEFLLVNCVGGAPFTMYPTTTGTYPWLCGWRPGWHLAEVSSGKGIFAPRQFPTLRLLSPGYTILLLRWVW